MSQTSVATSMTVALAGQIGDLEGMKSARIGTAVNNEASAGIPYGVMVCRDGTTPDTAKLLHTSAAAMAANQLLIGVSMLGAFEEGVEVIDDEIQPDVAFSVLMEGPIWVLPEDAVTPSSDVRVRVVVAGNEVAGAFRGAADSTDCVDITALARWLTSGSSSTPAMVWINMAHVGLAVADT